ncbi:hypothetical protein HZ997_01245 [Marinobacter salsuginis]|nr:hypothetical protein HZ997_01245 [Marinobacter salsuginis]
MRTCSIGGRPHGLYRSNELATFHFRESLFHL